ncbi:hypothetical protein L226DRAFT_222885 [Lentinus tigrinus ALCF2SS1-7]|uniref:uncharacterized protein n=1 Tax=Lentinus tigrinus ALCF2SS1-7 TaxID=1328758 RepID=UPI001165EF22|nr:hypothetical protein L226DRAFT_222885 [Lentinus tigrinus ALCF2SS1-7]
MLPSIFLSLSTRRLHCKAMDIYSRLALQRRFEVAAGVMFIYEYILTLDLEVEYFWESRLTAATVLFFGNRYTNILISVCSILGLAMEAGELP